MGSKEKFWYHDSELGKCLFKAARPGTGEDWAEKVAEQLCDLVGLPHARYELAIAGSAFGVVSPTFVAESEALVHGNELLAGTDARFAIGVQKEGGRTSQYTLPLVLEALEQSDARLRPAWSIPKSVTSVAELFVGYLMHDAWVGNTDRHQENWAIVEKTLQNGEVERYIAPQFDTASCLGRNESDQRRVMRMSTRDKSSSVEGYADRARSPFYLTPEATKPLTVFDAFHEAARLFPDAGRAWLAQLEAVDVSAIEGVISRFPTQRMSEAAREFVGRMLRYNRERLLGLVWIL